MKKIGFGFLILWLSLFIGCSNALISSNILDTQKHNETLPYNQNENKEKVNALYYLSGKINLEGAVPSELQNQKDTYNTKTALPAKPASIIYKITVLQNNNTVAIGYSTDGNFNIGIPAVAESKIQVEGYIGTLESDCVSSNWILIGSSTVSETALTSNVPLSISVSVRTYGNGTVSLPICVENYNEAVSVKIAWKNKDFDKEFTKTFTDSSIFYFDLQKNGENLDIPCGVYDTTFTFYSGSNCTGLEVYRCTEKINVFTNMVTDTWQDNGSIHIFDDGNKKVMKISNVCIAVYKRHEFFVSKTPVTDGTGTYFDPVSMERAFTLINSVNDGTQYTIYLKENLSENFQRDLNTQDADGEYSYLVLNPSNKLIVKICSYGNPSTPYYINLQRTKYGHPGRFASLYQNIELELENIIIKGGCITNPGPYPSCVKMYGGKLTLGNDCRIQGNACEVTQGATPAYGNAAISLEGDATLIMKEGSIIGGGSLSNQKNTSNAGPGGVYINNTAAVFKMEGGEISFNQSSSTNPFAGGVHLESGSFIMSGGKIENNSSYNAAYDDCVFNLKTESGVTRNAEIKGQIKLGTTQIFDNPVIIAEPLSQYSVDGTAEPCAVVSYGNTAGGGAVLQVIKNISTIPAGTDYVNDYYTYFESKDASKQINNTGFLVSPGGGNAAVFVPKTTDEITAEGYVSAGNYSTVNVPFPGTKIKCESSSDITTIKDIVDVGNTLEGVEIILTTSVDGVSTVIGSSSNKFSGTFDGNGNTISGLGISGGSYQGLFGSIKNATIKNLKVSGSVNVTYDTACGGGIAGEGSGNITLENCEVSVRVTGGSSSKYCGGLIGYIGSAGDVVIRNCINNGDVAGKQCVGGFIGHIAGDVTTLTIENCINKGTVTGTADYIGGFVGNSSCTSTNLINCVNSAKVTTSGSTTCGEIAGAISTNNTGGVSSCFYMENAASVGVLVGNSDIYDAATNPFKFPEACSSCKIMNPIQQTVSQVTIQSVGTYPIGSSVAQILNDCCDYNNSSSPGKYRKWKYNNEFQLEFE